MSETSYEQCHISYRGYMGEEIDAAREMLRKYGKPCPDAVKELRLKTDMPMSECGNMLRCLRRDAELEHIKSENAKLRKVIEDLEECDQIHRTMLRQMTKLKAKAKAENAKLHKLMQDIHTLGWNGFDCIECPKSFSERCHEDGGCQWLSILADLMSEFEIEKGELNELGTQMQPRLAACASEVPDRKRHQVPAARDQDRSQARGW